MTVDDLATATMGREGGYRDVPSDPGGPTNFGITAHTWGFYCGWNRPATAEEVQAITPADARAFYTHQVVTSAFATLDDPLRAQLFDFGVNSGAERAIRWLQRVLRVPVTSRLDALTLQALNAVPLHLVNNALVAARVRMYHDTVALDPAQHDELEGWINRAVEFLDVPAA